ncbi:unnamed protein product [Mesocestoides corti]|uniref:Tetraspanin n=1 Tax=Mesocestoides corti TaxID=53468 RepID=A0A3P6HRX0_MESCO|nr:unnamed protein product [Mesocestoides corti]
MAGFGGYLLYQLTFYTNQIGDVTKIFPVAVIVLGFVIFFVGFLGCCGACYESPCMLITFAAIVAILLCLQIAVAVFVFVYKDELMEFLSNRFEMVFNDSNGALREQIERDLNCCGFKKPEGHCLLTLFVRKPCWDVITSKVESSMYIIIATAGTLCLIQIAAIIAACCLQSKIRSYTTY